jgi:neutral ceramidase
VSSSVAPRRAWPWLPIVGVLLVLACSPGSQAVPAPLHAVPEGRGYLAAAAQADITPPLHLSLFGHGPEGRIAVGVRLRLNCQVFLIASQADIVALVPCDLQSPSMALQRLVAAKLAQIGIPITADRLFIMATHTHAAPGHYFEARRYSGPFSSQAPGYDERVLGFLAGRIAAGVADAFAALAPACLGWNRTNVWGLTFNRSYVPFLANPASGEPEDPATRATIAEQRIQTAGWRTLPAASQEDTSTTTREPSGPGAGSSSETAAVHTGAEAAVDPELSVLALYRRANDTLSCEGSRLSGVLAVFGMHPTGVPNTNELYHGDIFGFAVRVAEGRLSPPLPESPLGRLAAPRRFESASSDAERVIVGLANGVEGDVSPKMNFQSMPEARKQGRELGQAIERLTLDVPDRHAEGPLAHLTWDLKFPEGQYDADPAHRLCKHAELGMASTGGARDGPTRVRILPAANAGFQPVRLSECHDQKVPLRRGTSHSDHDFPQVGPIAVIQINDGILATVPGEVTTMTGRRIRQAIAKGLPARAAHVAVAGLTNQYFQYFATHEEYPFQFYEGASTLYGPHSEQFLVRHFGCLGELLANRPAECTGADVVNRPSTFEADPFPRADRWPSDEDVQAFGLDPLDVFRVQREGAIGWEMRIDPLPLTFTSDRAALSVAVLLAEGADVALDDDRGASIEIREVEDGEAWRIRWIPDLMPRDARCGNWFRIAVRGQVNVTSRPFLLECPRELVEARP